MGARTRVQAALRAGAQSAAGPCRALQNIWQGGALGVIPTNKQLRKKGCQDYR